MHKQMITSYRLSSQNGHSLDLCDAFFAVIVSPDSGDVLFHEGKDGLNGASMSGSMINGFAINEDAHLFLTFSCGTGDETHTIGRVAHEDLDVAKSWIKNVNRIYVGHSHFRDGTRKVFESISPHISSDNLFESNQKTRPQVPIEGINTGVEEYINLMKNSRYPRELLKNDDPIPIKAEEIVLLFQTDTKQKNRYSFLGCTNK